MQIQHARCENFSPGAAKMRRGCGESQNLHAAAAPPAFYTADSRHMCRPIRKYRTRRGYRTVFPPPLPLPARAHHISFVTAASSVMQPASITLPHERAFCRRHTYPWSCLVFGLCGEHGRLAERKKACKALEKGAVFVVGQTARTERFDDKPVAAAAEIVEYIGAQAGESF